MASARRSSVRIFALPVSVRSDSSHEHDPTRDLVRRDAPAQERAHVVLVDACGRGGPPRTRPRSRRGSGAGTPTAKAAVRPGWRSNVSSISTGRDVGASRLDEVARPAGPVQAAVLVDEAGVARVEEAVLVEARLGGHLDVALHQRRALHRDLAALPGAQRVAGRRVDDAQRVAGQHHAVVVGPLVGGRVGRQRSSRSSPSRWPRRRHAGSTRRRRARSCAARSS